MATVYNPSAPTFRVDRARKLVLVSYGDDLAPHCYPLDEFRTAVQRSVAVLAEYDHGGDNVKAFPKRR